MPETEGKMHLIKTSVAVLVSIKLAFINNKLLIKKMSLNTYSEYAILMLFLH